MEDIIDIIVTETTNLIEITSQASDETIDVNIIDNREDITLNVTPTLVEVNINQLTGNFGINWGEITGTLSNQTDLNTALGLKADLIDGKVPSSQLPSYVDDIVEVANYSALPATGETGKIYVVLDTNLIYRWSGSAYIEIKDSSAVWGAITGTLSSQTDLQSALDAKLSTSTAASTYVPYTGATATVDIGTNLLKAGNFTAVGQGEGGVLNLYKYASRTIAGDGYVSLFANDSVFGFVDWVSANLRTAQFSLASISNNTTKTYTLPNASGTLALTSDLHNAVTIGTANGLSLSTQVLSLGLASSSANGALSSTDWTTFNAKQQALSGTGFVKISGTTISYDNSTYLTTSAAASTYVPYTGATANVNLGTNTLTFGTNSYVLNSSGGAQFNLDGADAFNTQLGLASGTVMKWLIGNSGETDGNTLFIKKSITYNSGTTAFTINYTTLDSTFFGKIIKNGGTSSQFLKADGSVDSSTYLTTSNAASTYLTIANASSTYLPLSGGTLTGNLNGVSAKFSKSSNSGSGATFPRLQVENTLATQGDGSSTFNFADIRIASGNDAVQMLLSTSFASGIWEPQASINVVGAHPLIIKTSNTERYRTNSDGHTLFGTTGTSWTNTAGFYIFYQSAVNITRNGAEAMTLNRLTSDGEILRFFRSGNQVGNISVTTSATSYNTSSDYRLKEDLKPINGLDIVNKIKVYDYKWKSEDSRMDGVLAHELAEILPYAVTGIKDGEQMQGVDYSKIVPVMVQAIKELKAELDTLKNK